MKPQVRPPGVTDTVVSAWKEQIKAHSGGPPSGILGVFVTEDEYFEVMYALYWLEQRLRELPGLTAGQIVACGNAASQIMVGRDFWEVATKTLSLAAKGRFFVAGKQLSLDLLQGKLDSEFGPGGGLSTPEDAKRYLYDVLGCDSVEAVFAKLGVANHEEALEKLTKELGPDPYDFLPKPKDVS